MFSLNLFKTKLLGMLKQGLLNRHCFKHAHQNCNARSVERNHHENFGDLDSNVFFSLNQCNQFVQLGTKMKLQVPFADTGRVVLTTKF